MGFQCEFNICSIFLKDHVFEGFSTRDFFLILHSKIEKPKKLRLIISKKSKKKNQFKIILHFFLPVNHQSLVTEIQSKEIELINNFFLPQGTLHFQRPKEENKATLTQIENWAETIESFRHSNFCSSKTCLVWSSRNKKFFVCLLVLSFLHS